MSQYKPMWGMNCNDNFWIKMVDIHVGVLCENKWKKKLTNFTQNIFGGTSFIIFQNRVRVKQKQNKLLFCVFVLVGMHVCQEDMFFSKSPKPMEVVEGKPVTLFCEVTPNNGISYYWELNGEFQQLCRKCRYTFVIAFRRLSFFPFFRDNSKRFIKKDTRG